MKPYRCIGCASLCGSTASDKPIEYSNANFNVHCGMGAKDHFAITKWFAERGWGRAKDKKKREAIAAIKAEIEIIELITTALEKNISITFCMSKTDPLVPSIQGRIDGISLGFPINYTRELIVERMKEILEQLSIYGRR